MTLGGTQCWKPPQTHRKPLKTPNTNKACQGDPKMTPKETLSGELRRQGTGIWGPYPKPRATHFYSAAALQLKETERVTRNSNSMAPRETARQKTPRTPVNPKHPTRVLKIFICTFGHQGAPEHPQNGQNRTQRPKPVETTPRTPIRSQNW